MISFKKHVFVSLVYLFYGLKIKTKYYVLIIVFLYFRKKIQELQFLYHWGQEKPPALQREPPNFSTANVFLFSNRHFCLAVSGFAFRKRIRFYTAYIKADPDPESILFFTNVLSCVIR
jgi:hypothetical protein